jgi:C-terminal processing protease CtpA/Prc
MRAKAMNATSICLRPLAGALVSLASAGAALAQYQDTSSDSARGYPNSRVQSNISDQGSGYGPAPYGPYGQYYSRMPAQQNQVNQEQTGGLPSSGVSVSSDAAWRMLYRARRPVNDWGVIWAEDGDQLVAVEVSKDSELDKAGLLPADELVSVDSELIHSRAEWRHTMAAVKPGKEVEIVVRQDGKLSTMHVTFAPPPSEELPPPAESGSLKFITAARLQSTPRGQARLGVALDEQAEDRAVVRAVSKRSPAEMAGLKPGDAILSISGRDVRSPEELVQLVLRAKPGTTVEIYVERERAKPATPDDPSP